MSKIELTRRQTRWSVWLLLVVFFAFTAYHSTVIAPNEPISPYNRVMSIAWLFGLGAYALHRMNQHFNIVGVKA